MLGSSLVNSGRKGKVVGNDMTWEQKCRISALRAACASQFTIYGTPVHLSTPPDGETDEHMTTRILQRAEVFREALLRDGTLDGSVGEIQEESTPSPVNEQVYIGTCKHCLTAIQLFEPFNDGARWIDANGYSQCAGKQVREHEPELEKQVPESNVCPGCGSSSKKVRKIVASVPSAPDLYCNGPWHQE
jgi:rubredoxin